MDEALPAPESESSDGPVGDHPHDPPVDDATADGKGMSLDQLSEAFATMLETGQGHLHEASLGDESDQAAEDAVDDPSVEVTPGNILEAMLFVGSPENQSLSREEAASLMRGVEPCEIDVLVDELNATYEADGSAYEIVSRGTGFQMVLRDEFSRVRDKFYGRARQAKLSQAAIEVLAIVAYNQPVSSEDVSRLRGTPSGAVLSQLVRRQLLRMERPEANPRRPHFHTTSRFLRLFGLDQLEDLPRSEDLDSRL